MRRAVQRATAAMLVVALAALTSGCGKQPRADAPDARPPPEFVELGLDEFSSPFTKETVLALNAIVSKSLEIVRDYDGSIGEIRAAVDAARAPGASAGARSSASDALQSLARLSEKAGAARAEMDAAVAALNASGEAYNDEILAGMVMFVEQVDDEIRAENARLSEGGD